VAKGGIEKRKEGEERDWMKKEAGEGKRQIIKKRENINPLFFRC